VIAPLATSHALRAHTGPTGVSSAFGTFGELLQGALPEEDGDFLVTLPIARWSVATFRGSGPSDDVRVHPPHKHKALRLVHLIMADAGWLAGGELTIDSGLPEGKGLASSSADLVATARAVANALRIDMPARRIESYLRRIEPTDGVLYPGIVAYHHRSVRLRAMLGTLPSMTVVGVDEGGLVDTVAFNRIPKPFTAADHREYARLLDRVGAAVLAKDLAAVGAVATRSAVLNQVLRPKRMLESIIEVNAEVGGLGVVAAHSGTTLGVLLDTADPSYSDRLLATASACAAVAGNVTVHRTIGAESGPHPC
jgi:uncharacterized protein involved in propanediol utilization